MQRSASFIDRPTQQRGVYLNQETNKREVQTIFHSPFKDGRRNKQFLNPSFLSSHLFYAPGCLQPASGLVIRRNWVQNQNDKSHQHLYQERMLRETSAQNIPREVQNEARQQRQKPKRTRRIDNREDRLLAELDNLRNYRQEIERDSALPQKPINMDLPAYFDNSRRDVYFEQKRANRQRQEMSQWVAVTNDLRDRKSSLRKERNQQENENVSKEIHRRREAQIQQQICLSRNSQILANILKEQIRAKQAREGRRK